MSAQGSRLALGIWRLLRFVVRHIFAIALLILLLLTGITVAFNWAIGVRGIIPQVYSVAIYLALIIAVAILWVLKGSLARWLQRRRQALEKRAAQELVRQGMGRGEAVLRAAGSEARERLTQAGEQLKAEWQRYSRGASRAGPQPAAPRCPSCQRIVRTGARFCDRCGVPLPSLCPQCGRARRPKAQFCDGCGAKVK